MADKYQPINEKEYIVTDFCFWQEMNEEERAMYNPYDKTRAPHGIQLIDVETGTVVNLVSGSTIRIVKAREVDNSKEEDGN